MLVLPKRELNDLFWPEALVVPELKSMFENIADLDPKEIENSYISEEKDWILTLVKLCIVLHGQETTFTITWDILKRIKGLLDVREGSYYV